MISVIVCSRNPSMLAALRQNVAQTIGVPHEVVSLDNSEGQYGICEAYNLGAARAKYGLLCFAHEDLAFHTQGWGNIVAEVLADETVGVLGVAGSTYQLNVPSAWWWSGASHLRMNVLHSPPGQQSVLDIINPTASALTDVVVLDGLWLCSRAEVWKKFPFDQQLFSEFHFYDVDYCTSICSDYRICVTFSIQIEHFSLGSINEMWLRNAIKYQQKWQSKLPIGVEKVLKEQNYTLERGALIKFLQMLLSYNFKSSVKLLYIKKLFRYRPITRDYFWFLKRILLNK